MSTRLGPFQHVYTPREQKIRDTIAHLVQKHGIVKARMIVNDEYLLASQVSNQEIIVWWNDVRWHIKQMIHSLNWGQEKGL